MAMTDRRTFIQAAAALPMTAAAGAAFAQAPSEPPAPQAKPALAKDVTRENVPLTALIPAFIISELKTAFIIGFYIFIPFLIIDLIVSSGLMSMGMMMLPPTVVSLPVKLLIFVLADGWATLTAAIMAGYR